MSDIGAGVGKFSEKFEKGFLLGLQIRRNKLLRKQRILALKQADFKARNGLRDFFKENADPALLEAQFNDAMGSIGEDPNSPRNKQFKQTLLKLNDETKARIGRALMRRDPDLQPGELSNFVTQIMRKEITIPQAFKIMTDRESRLTQKGTEAALQAPLAGGETEAERLRRVGKSAAPGSPGTARALSNLAAQERLSPEGVAKTERVKATESLRKQELEIPIAARKAAAIEIAKATAFNLKELPKEVVLHLGLNPKIAHSRSSIAPINVATQPERVKLRSLEGAARKALGSTRRVVRQLENNPKLLSVPGFISRGFTNIVGALEGLAQLAPGEFVEPGGVRNLLEKTPILGNLAKTGRESAKLRANIIDLTLRSADTVSRTGKKFTIADYQNISKQFATSTASADLMVGVLRTLAMVQSTAFNIEFEAVHKTTKFIGLPNEEGLQQAPFSDLERGELKGIIKELLSPRQMGMYRAEVQFRLDNILEVGGE